MRCAPVFLAGALALLTATALGGCPASDFCQPEADSVRTFIVNPSTDPAPDNDTAVHSFHSIQGALDAAGGDRGRATVCVAGGTYREQITVPANTHLLGKPGRVRLRAPQVRASALPTDVDRILLSLATGAEGPIVVDGLDVRGAGLCVDVTGQGEATLRDDGGADCAGGLRVRGGATARLERTPLGDHAIRGVAAVSSRVELLEGSHLLRNGRPATWHEQDARLEAPAEAGWGKDLLPGHGALASRDSDVTLHSVTVDETEFDGAALSLEGGSLSATSVILGAQLPAATTEGFVAGDAGGAGTVLALTSVDAVLDRIVARTEGQGLITLAGADNALVATNLSWSAQLATTGDPGSTGPALGGSGSGTIQVLHATLLGSGEAWGIDLEGGPWDLELQNSILWGQTQGRGLRVADGTVTLEYLLVEDASMATGGTIVFDQAPEFTDAAAGLLIPEDSPARCAGTDLGVANDLNGDPRPFSAGKAPDLGAIELQQACP